MADTPTPNLPALPPDPGQGRIAQAIVDFVGHIPPSRVDSSGAPDAAARRLAASAAQRAALTAGSLALPPGPLGWLTVLPELVAIWKIQAQMVSDIAAAYGKHAVLGREQMLWCLFRHTTAQAFRDLVVRMGDRLLFRRLSYGLLQQLAQRIGITLSKRVVGKSLSRWLPVVGAAGVGAYAYYDTNQVARSAIELFSGQVDLEDTLPDPDRAAARREVKRAAREVGAAGRATGKAVRKALDRTVARTAGKVAEAAGKTTRRAAVKKAGKRPPADPGE
jgi:hypothetical protein